MGLSPLCAPYTLTRLAQLVAEAIPPQADICGWSLGGQVAMQLALDSPQQVRRLLLAGSTPRFVNSADWQHGIAAYVFRQFAHNVATDYQETMRRFLGLQAFGGEASRSRMRELRERFVQRPLPDPEALRLALDILLQTDFRGQLSQLQQPMLLLHGDRDTLAPVAAAYWMADHIPQAQLHVIAGASHAPFLSHPASFLTEVTRFLEH
jgi:pimeloyl-[acyl-carrier protein] methyl ester esterase